MGVSGALSVSASLLPAVLGLGPRFLGRNRRPCARRLTVSRAVGVAPPVSFGSRIGCHPQARLETVDRTGLALRYRQGARTSVEWSASVGCRWSAGRPTNPGRYRCRSLSPFKTPTRRMPTPQPRPRPTSLPFTQIGLPDARRARSPRLNRMERVSTSAAGARSRARASGVTAEAADPLVEPFALGWPRPQRRAPSRAYSRGRPAAYRRRKPAVGVSAVATASGGPCATTAPPSGPAPGPRSITQSADAATGM